MFVLLVKVNWGVRMVNMDLKNRDLEPAFQKNVVKVKCVSCGKEFLTLNTSGFIKCKECVK